MLKKARFILTILLPVILLIGCNGNESGGVSTTNSRVEVRIIEDFEVSEYDMPSYLYLNWWNRSLQVLNGLTGEIEQNIEFSEYHRLNLFPQPMGDYYVMSATIVDTLEEDVAQVIATEYLIFDQNFNLIEELVITEDIDIIFKIGNTRQIGQNEAGEWIAYGFNGDRIYAYNFHTEEMSRIAIIEEGWIRDILLMPNVNQLAFTLLPEFDLGWQEYIEFGFIDLETLEMNIAHQVENVAWPPNLVLPRNPIIPPYEFLLVETSIGNDMQSESEVLLIHPLTGEVRMVSIGSDDFWGDGYEFSATGHASSSMDGQLVFKSVMEQNEEPVDGWSFSNLMLRVGLYDTQTGVAVFEHLLVDKDTLALDENIEWATLVPISESIYLIRARVLTGFTETNDDRPTGVRFEYIFVEIVVHEDE